ncbi:MAG: arsenite methyltransferase [Cyclobacteriaceae bacterium]|nr:arsenite methyltransferase [Cyclobacteriaceae bacterium]
MNNLTAEDIRKEVRENYAKVTESSGCGGPTDNTACCTPGIDTVEISSKLGYSEEELKRVPDNANLGLGCGNPQALASLKEGEIVLDLGSGAGFDAFLASKGVGSTGKVIGVDMTSEMIDKARENIKKGGYKNVEFRLGEIENLPIKDNYVDVIISNCVINLSPEKEKVFAESFRVLKTGGRLAISDIITTATLPEEFQNDLNLLSGCVSGSESAPVLEKMLKQVGFTEVTLKAKDESREFLKDWVPGKNIQDYIVSATIEAIKP